MDAGGPRPHRQLSIMAIGLVVGLALIAHGVAADPTSYSGHKVLNIRAVKDDSLHSFLHLAKKLKLDVWKYPKRLNDSLHVQVSPGNLQVVLMELQERNMEFGVMIDDIKKLIDEQTRSAYNSASRKKRTARRFSLNDYHSVDEIYSFLDSVCSESRSICNQFSIGLSSEGRNLKLIQVSSADRRARKPAILIDAGTHGREWISIPTLLRIIHELAINPKKSNKTIAALDNFDWFFIPIVNPDGYEYSRTTDRLWRKSRSRSYNYNNCVGADINRNFPYFWAVSGVSEDPCSELYVGPHALSEPEASSLANIMQMYRGWIHAYISLHAYGQMWLYPWGYTSEQAKDKRDMARLALKAAAAMKKSRKYSVGQSSTLLYKAAGGSDDYAKGETGIKYAYTLELPDTGKHGFLLPRQMIMPIARETMNGIFAFSRALFRKLKRRRRKRSG